MKFGTRSTLTTKTVVAVVLLWSSPLVRLPARNVAPLPTPTARDSCDLNVSTYINCISLSNRTLSLIGTTPEDRALQWLVDNDERLPHSDANKARLRKRFGLLTWGFQPLPNGELIYQQANWNLSAASECDWYNNIYFWAIGQIQCKNGHVTSIGSSIYYRPRAKWLPPAATLPPDLGLLTTLQAVQFQSVGLKGTIPSSLGLLTNLYLFDVSYGSIAGTLPSSIGAWTAIVTIIVSNNRYLYGTVPSTVAAWTSLRSAWFDNTNLTGVMPTFGMGGFCPKNASIDTSLAADCWNSSLRFKISCSCCSTCL
jgi:hypothetical protein